MTHQGAQTYAPGLADAGGQIAQLRQILALVREISGSAERNGDAMLDEAARISGAYEAAPPLVQRRFDALAEETARWSAAGVEALLALRERGLPYAPAATRLGDELEAALGRLRFAAGA